MFIALKLVIMKQLDISTWTECGKVIIYVVFRESDDNMTSSNCSFVISDSLSGLLF